MRQIVECDWTWTGAAFESGVQVAIDPEGRIKDVGALGETVTKRLTKQALLPGMINAHSHAFQRGLRGYGEFFPVGAGSFWTWREAMYRLVDRLDADSFYDLNLRAFREMRRSGITTVGEFHYFHHSKGTVDYLFDALVLRAAAAAGIRIVLLNSFYNTGGIGQPLSSLQQRFKTDSLESYWSQIESLESALEGKNQTLGVVAHSIRAAKLEDIASLHRESRLRQMPFHLHVEEQRKEIEDSISAYGQPPLALLNGVLEDMRNVTAVHCTHSNTKDMETFLDGGGTVCVCPLTEGNLGDGVPHSLPDEFRTARTVLGTDSNARICMTEEMRWLEYGQRLRGETRGVYTDKDGSSAGALYSVATESGARALHLETGRIAPGQFADFVAIDLTHPTLRECDERSLLDSFVFGAGNEVIAATCVGGVWGNTS